MVSTHHPHSFSPLGLGGQRYEILLHIYGNFFICAQRSIIAAIPIGALVRMAFLQFLGLRSVAEVARLLG